MGASDRSDGGAPLETTSCSCPHHSLCHSATSTQWRRERTSHEPTKGDEGDRTGQGGRGVERTGEWKRQALVVVAMRRWRACKGEDEGRREVTGGGWWDEWWGVGWGEGLVVSTSPPTVLPSSPLLPLLPLSAHRRLPCRLLIPPIPSPSHPRLALCSPHLHRPIDDCPTRLFSPTQCAHGSVSMSILVGGAALSRVHE